MSILSLLQVHFPKAVTHTHTDFGDATAVVKREAMLAVFKWLRDDSHLQFDILMDIAGVDYHRRRPRYEVVYHLNSLSRKYRLRVKVTADDPDPEVDSLTGLWKSANWYEREVWDMYGIRFKGHPNLERILLYDSFKGHPLRKDYPLNKRQPLIGPKN